QIVADCIEKVLVLETYPLESYRGWSELFEEDVYEDIGIVNCVEKRISKGGTSSVSVQEQIAWLGQQIKTIFG
ncbi:MAG: argininosuccinate lyase, partial [Lachnospiraceae bacterium]|nr:argininosuccinate lyase [Lachnospiraceae bacterium]